MAWLYWTVACFGSVFVLIAVHETGHFLAGWLGGIPVRDMRVRLLTFPQHVALRVDDKWVSPGDIEPYVAKMQACLPTSPRLFLYTAGGFLLETVFALGAVGVALALGYRWPAQVVALCSAWLLGSYVLLMDLPFTLRYGVPCGDLSGLWWVARVPTALLAIAMFTIRVLLLWVSFAEPPRSESRIVPNSVAIISFSTSSGVISSDTVFTLMCFPSFSVSRWVC